MPFCLHAAFWSPLYANHTRGRIGSEILHQKRELEAQGMAADHSCEAAIGQKLNANSEVVEVLASAIGGDSGLQRLFTTAPGNVFRCDRSSAPFLRARSRRE